MDNSILEKLTKATSAEDLQSIAKKCGLDKISLDEAKKLFEQLKSKGSISADSLKSIVGSIGGSGSTKSGSADKTKEVKEAADAVKDVLSKFKK